MQVVYSPIRLALDADGGFPRIEPSKHGEGPITAEAIVRATGERVAILDVDYHHGR